MCVCIEGGVTFRDSPTQGRRAYGSRSGKEVAVPSREPALEAHVRFSKLMRKDQLRKWRSRFNVAVSGATIVSFWIRVESSLAYREKSCGPSYSRHAWFGGPSRIPSREREADGFLHPPTYTRHTLCFRLRRRDVRDRNARAHLKMGLCLEAREQRPSKRKSSEATPPDRDGRL